MIEIQHWITSITSFRATKLYKVTLPVVKVLRIDDISDFSGVLKSAGEDIDLLLSTEVLQRLDETMQIKYLKGAAETARFSVIFVPNEGNIAHAKISKLNALGMHTLNDSVKGYSTQVFSLRF